MRSWSRVSAFGDQAAQSLWGAALSLAAPVGSRATVRASLDTEHRTGGDRRYSANLGANWRIDPRWSVEAQFNRSLGQSTAVSLDPPAAELATGYGTLRVRPAAAGEEVLLETRGEERLLYRVDRDPASVSVSAAKGSSEETELFRLLDDRLLRFRGGVLEVTDAWSRLRVPFPARDGDGLEALFGPPAPPDDGREAAGQPPTLAVYLASGARPEALRALLADPESFARTLPEGWTATDVAVRADGFAWSVREGEEFLRTERMRIVPDGLVLEAEGPLALFRSRTLRLEPRPDGTRLRLLGVLRDPVPPRGLPEGTRRRLVFELANELLALDRVAAGG